jgi:hypothetical protein
MVPKPLRSGQHLRMFEKLGFSLPAYVDFLFNESFYGQLEGKISITFHANI